MGEEGIERCNLRLELIAFADVMVEDTKHKGGVKVNPMSGLNW